MRDTSEDGWCCFLKLCHQVKTKEQFRELFDCFLTVGEKEDIAHRIEIVKVLLEESKTQRKIAQDLGVSIAKITRGSNQLKQISEKLKKFLVKMLL